MRGTTIGTISTMQVVIFTKMFWKLGVEETGERVKALGFDGLELVRKQAYRKRLAEGCHDEITERFVAT